MYDQDLVADLSVSFCTNCYRKWLEANQQSGKYSCITATSTDDRFHSFADTYALIAEDTVLNCLKDITGRIPCLAEAEDMRTSKEHRKIPKYDPAKLDLMI